MTSREHAKNDIELFINGFGLQAVLELVVEICHDKAEHVQSTWQDRKLAHAWQCKAAAIERALARIARRAE